jgi:hypothetical protein
MPGWSSYRNRCVRICNLNFRSPATLLPHQAWLRFCLPIRVRIGHRSGTNGSEASVSSDVINVPVRRHGPPDLMANSRPEATGTEHAANIPVPARHKAKSADSTDANRSGYGALEHQHVGAVRCRNHHSILWNALWAGVARCAGTRSTITTNTTRHFSQPPTQQTRRSGAGTGWAAEAMGQAYALRNPAEAESVARFSSCSVRSEPIPDTGSRRR